MSIVGAYGEVAKKKKMAGGRHSVIITRPTGRQTNGQHVNDGSVWDTWQIAKKF